MTGLFVAVVSAGCLVWLNAQPSDSPATGNSAPEARQRPDDRGRFDVRYGPDLLEIEGSYRLLWLMSGNVAMTTEGVRAGLSLAPVSVIAVDGWIGQAISHENVTDAAPFSPDYAYGWRLSTRVPLGRSMFHLSTSFGQAWAVQNRYNANSGFIIGGGSTEPRYVRRIEQRSEFTIGAGVHF